MTNFKAGDKVRLVPMILNFNVHEDRVYTIKSVEKSYIPETIGELELLTGKLTNEFHMLATLDNDKVMNFLNLIPEEEV